MPFDFQSYTFLKIIIKTIKQTIMKTYILKIILALFLITNSSYSNPTYELRAKNFTYTAINILEYDIFLKRTGTTPLEYETGQYIFNFNTAFANGGTLTFSIVAGSSQLPSGLNPNVADVYSDELRIAPTATNCDGSGFFILNTGDGTKVARIRLQTSAACGFTGNLNLTWKNSLGFFTKLFSYGNFSYLNITNPAGHFVDPDLTSTSTNVTVIAGTNTTNFFNLYQAFNAINNGGIYTGKDITVNINTSVVEPITATLKGEVFNTCIIKPAANNVTVTASSCATDLIILDGADKVTIDGRINQTGAIQLTLINSSISNYSCIKMINGSTENNIQSLKSTCSGGANINIAGSISPATTGNNKNRIENCIITGKTKGVSISGISSLLSNNENKIIKNDINNCSEQGIRIGSYTLNSIVIGNKIFNTTPVSTVTFTAISFYGNGNGNGNVNPIIPPNTISQNKIYNLDFTNSLTDITGIDINPANNIATILDVNNNFISLGANLPDVFFIIGIKTYDISITNFTENIYYNSVYIDGSHNSGFGGTYGITLSQMLPLSTSSIYNQKNNISVNVRSGAPENLASSIVPFGGPSLNVDYNCYWTTTDMIAAWDGTLTGDLCTYHSVTSTNEQNTVFKNVNFASPITGGDLHLIAPSIGDIDLVAKPIAGITGDIDDPATTRHSVNPYKGADESTTLLSLQPGIVIVRVNSLDRTFPNLKSAFDEINANACQRYSGKNVEVIITTNTFENATPQLNAIFPAFLTCLIRPSVTGIAVTATAQIPALILLYEADNVTIDGNISGTRSLTLKGEDLVTNCIKLDNGSKDNVIQNITSEKSTGVNIKISSPATSGNNNNRIENCLVKGGTKGISITGNSSFTNDDNKVINNTVNDCSAGGIAIQEFTLNTQVNGNKIFNTSYVNAFNYTAISFTGNGLTNTITQNKIYKMYFANSMETITGIDINPTNNITTAVNANNNFISIIEDIPALTVMIGIKTDNLSITDFTENLYHNTIFIGGTYTAASYAIWFYQTNSLPATVIFNQKNNICVNEKTAGNYNFASYITHSGGLTLNVDNNCYWALGNIAGWNGVLHKSLPDYQCAAGTIEQNTIFKNVNFIDKINGDLHLTGTSIGDYDLIGLTGLGIANDIDPNVRSTTAPYMGADEGTPFTFSGTIRIKAYIDGYKVPSATPVNMKIDIWDSDGSKVYNLLLANQTVTLSTSGTAIINCPAAVSPTHGKFHIVLKKPGCLDTWSKNGGETMSTIPGQFLNYDFTTSTSQAYCGNMKSYNCKSYIFNGDINGDGQIDMDDFILVQNDAEAIICPPFGLGGSTNGGLPTNNQPTDITNDNPSLVSCIDICLLDETCQWFPRLISNPAPNVDVYINRPDGLIATPFPHTECLNNPDFNYCPR